MRRTLTLKRETLAALGVDDLQQVRGGVRVTAQPACAKYTPVVFEVTTTVDHTPICP
jgi:hypothetical protein